MNFGRRLLLFLHWLISVALLAAIVFSDMTVKLAEKLRELMGANYAHIVFIACAAIYVVMCIAVVCLIFKRDGKRSDRGFITVDSSETGKVRIAISAIEQMVKQAVCAVDGITEMKINISNMDDAIAINVNVTLVAGSHVPTVTLNMQRAIRQFVEMNCGVSVRSVSISIQAVTNATENGRRSRRSEVKPAAPATPWQPEVPVPEAVSEPVAAPSGDYEQEEPVSETVSSDAPAEESFYAEQPVVEAVDAENAEDAEAPAVDEENI